MGSKFESTYNLFDADLTEVSNEQLSIQEQIHELLYG